MESHDSTHAQELLQYHFNLSKQHNQVNKMSLTMVLKTADGTNKIIMDASLVSITTGSGLKKKDKCFCAIHGLYFLHRHNENPVSKGDGRMIHISFISCLSSV